MSSVSLRNVSFSYSRSGSSPKAVENLSFDVREGEICAVLGPSGSGKSTLLRIVSGIVKGYSGEVLVDGRRPDPKSVPIGYIPQNYGLLPWKRVKDNIELPARVRGASLDGKYYEYEKEVIESLGLVDKLKRFPGELSGGERQRVALARAFVSRPGLLLMDEPFSALDAVIAARSKTLFMELWQRSRVTSLLVTHNIDEAVAMSDRIVILSKSPGRLVGMVENDRSDYKAVLGHVSDIIKEEWV